MEFLGYGMFSRSSTRVISGILLWFKMIRTSLCSGNSSRRFKKNTPGTVDLESHISSIQVWISPIWLRFWNLTNLWDKFQCFAEYDVTRGNKKSTKTCQIVLKTSNTTHAVHARAILFGRFENIVKIFLPWKYNFQDGNGILLKQRE